MERVSSGVREERSARDGCWRSFNRPASVFLSPCERDGAVVAGPEMKSEKTAAAQFLKATKQK